MKRKLLIPWLFALISFSCLSQSALIAGGGDNEEGQLSFTIGQIFFQPESYSGFTLQPGLQQSFLGHLSTTETWRNEPIDITVFPNPTNDYLYVEIEDPKIQKFKYQLFNTMGQLITEGHSDVGMVQIPTQHLSASYYILKVIVNQNKSFSFQIIKS